MNSNQLEIMNPATQGHFFFLVVSYLQSSLFFFQSSCSIFGRRENNAKMKDQMKSIQQYKDIFLPLTYEYYGVFLSISSHLCPLQ